MTSWPPYSPTNAPIFQLSSDGQMAFYLAEVMALSQNSGANSGEVLRIATQIIPHDFESVYSAFYYMAEQVNDIAQSVNVTKDPYSAREAYFRAASYYRGADFFLLGNQTDPRIDSLWVQQLAAFDKAIALLDIPGERFTVKAHGDSIGDHEAIGVFYAAQSEGWKEATPSILVGNGYDGSQEESYHQACLEILARGMNCVTYEGPGQPTVRRQQGIGFVSDWWSAVTPVVDYLSTRQEVDMSKLALVGISFGGTLAPRAASHDHRFSAVVAIDGMYSFRQALEESFPPRLIQLYNSSNVTAFDEVVIAMAANTSVPSNFRWIIDQSLYSFATTSPYDWFTRIGEIIMGPDIVKNLPMPVFVAKGQDDALTLQEPEIAYQMLKTGRPNGTALTTYHEFLTSLGAGEHCSIGAEAQLYQVVMEWLSDVWDIETYASKSTDPEHA